MKKKLFDPFLLLILVLGFLTLGFLLISPQIKLEQESAPIPTTYSKDARGLKGLYMVLESLQKDTRRWSRPLPLLENEEIGTLVVVNPRKPLSPKEAEALDSWFSRGGCLFLLHDKDWDIKASGYDQAALSFTDRFRENSQLHAISKWTKLTNEELKANPKAGVSLIEKICHHPGPVYFDEYHLYNSEKASFWALIQRFCNHPFGWVALHSMIVFFLYLSSAANPRIYEENKRKMQLIQARTSFLEFFQAKDFAGQLIDKYRRLKK